MKIRVGCPESVLNHLKSYLCTYYYGKTQIMLRMNVELMFSVTAIQKNVLFLVSFKTGCCMTILSNVKACLNRSSKLLCFEF